MYVWVFFFFVCVSKGGQLPKGFCKVLELFKSFTGAHNAYTGLACALGNM